MPNNPMVKFKAISILREDDAPRCSGGMRAALRLNLRRHFPIFPAPKIMADDKKDTYDESKVKTLSSIEHIRLRTDWRCGSCGKLVENEN